MQQHIDAARRLLSDHSVTHGTGRTLPRAFHGVLSGHLTALVAGALTGDGLPPEQRPAFNALVAALKLDVGVWILLANTPGVGRWPGVNVPPELVYDPDRFDRLRVALDGLTDAKTPEVVSGGWSAADSPSHWAKRFGVSLDTLKRRIADGIYHVRKDSSRLWRFPVNEIPADK